MKDKALKARVAEKFVELVAARGTEDADELKKLIFDYGPKKPADFVAYFKSKSQGGNS